MPLREETIVLEEELERVKKRREELAEEVANMAAENPTRQSKAQEGIQFDAYVDGLSWAAHNAADDPDVPEWGGDADAITLAGLTAGEFGAVEGDLMADSEGRNPAKVERVYQVRAGTIDAPYLDDDMDDAEAIYAVASLPVGFLKWAEWKVDELSSVGDERGNDFADLVAKKQSESAKRR